jgi:hypothetical protein
MNAWYALMTFDEVDTLIERIEVTDAQSMIQVNNLCQYYAELLHATTDREFIGFDVTEIKTVHLETLVMKQRKIRQALMLIEEKLLHYEKK